MKWEHDPQYGIANRAIQAEVCGNRVWFSSPRDVFCAICGQYPHDYTFLHKSAECRFVGPATYFIGFALDDYPSDLTHYGGNQYIYSISGTTKEEDEYMAEHNHRVRVEEWDYFVNYIAEKENHPYRVKDGKYEEYNG